MADSGSPRRKKWTCDLKCCEQIVLPLLLICGCIFILFGGIMFCWNVCEDDGSVRYAIGSWMLLIGCPSLMIGLTTTLVLVACDQRKHGDSCDQSTPESHYHKIKHRRPRRPVRVSGMLIRESIPEDEEEYEDDSDNERGLCSGGTHQGYRSFAGSQV